MEHAVFYTADGGTLSHARADDLDSAVAIVERLRNEHGVTDAEVFAMTPVPVSFTPYFVAAVGDAPTAPPPLAATAGLVMAPLATPEAAPPEAAPPEAAQAESDESEAHDAPDEHEPEPDLEFEPEPEIANPVPVPLAAVADLPVALDPESDIGDTDEADILLGLDAPAFEPAFEPEPEVLEVAEPAEDPEPAPAVDDDEFVPQVEGGPAFATLSAASDTFRPVRGPLASVVDAVEEPAETPTAVPVAEVVPGPEAPASRSFGFFAR